MKKNNKGRFERIRCPNCGKIQEAWVEYWFPWNSYVHECVSCKYIIMESEWEKVDDQEI